MASRPVLLLFLAALAARGDDLPAWWKAFPGLARFESAFVQKSDSAVFGTLKREGLLQLAKGGHLRVAYQKGLLFIADGATLIQFDPAAATAQRLDLRVAARDMPLMNILTDLRALDEAYLAKPAPGEAVQLEPRRSGLPAVLLEGGNGFLRRVTWTDGTGARQVLELTSPHVPKAPFPPATFTFQPPAGVRWLN